MAIIGQTQVIEITDVPDEVLAQIDAEATTRGMRWNDLLREVVTNRFAIVRNTPVLSLTPPNDEEAHLLSEIRRDFPAAFWARYSQLARALEEEAIAEPDLGEFRKMPDMVEAANVTRTRHLIALTQIRNVPYLELVDTLKIRPRPWSEAADGF